MSRNSIIISKIIKCMASTEFLVEIVYIRPPNF